MGAQPPDRRALIAGLAALGAAARRAAAIGGARRIIEMGQSASRLQDLPDPDRTTSGYEPPARLTAVLDIYKRMTGAVLVGGAGPYPFVADTGANQSVISAELAAKLELPLGPTRSR